ncbi:MAG TPA: DUF3102 domain-containing protein [Ktedonobacteraceae bacterium]|nr:DUF3102 domain-containing protein [Ktedonobacteraceae bacterium]
MHDQTHQYSQQERLPEPEQEACYSGLPAETVRSLRQRVLKIRALVVQSVIEIGRELSEAKEEIRPYQDGGFKNWVETEIGITEQYAYALMNAYEHFGKTKIILVSHFVNTALLLLSAPSVPQVAREEALQLAEAGEKITVGRAKAIIEAQRAQKQAEEAEQRARTEAQAAQQHLREMKAASEESISRLTQRITALERERLALATPPVEIREVEKEVIPPEVTAQLDALQAHIQQLTEQRNALAKKAEELSADLETWREAREEDQERALREQRTRQHWRELTDAFSKQVVKFLGQFPSPLDTHVFGVDEWDRLAQVEQLTQRLLTECRALREAPQRIIIDADQ